MKRPLHSPFSGLEGLCPSIAVAHYSTMPQATPRDERVVYLPVVKSTYAKKYVPTPRIERRY